MVNITHSIGGLTFALLPLTYGYFLDSSLWIIVFSIFLGQFMDLDLKKSSISKKRGLRSFGKIIQYISLGHREQTHSLFFSIIIGILLSPIALYFSFADGSGFISNVLMIILSVFSHLVLDMFNIKGVPFFYIPYLNPIGKAKYYTWATFIGTFFENISDYFTDQSKKYKSPILAKISNFTRNNLVNKFKFNFGLKVSSENEFKFITIPLFLIMLYLIGVNGNLLITKISSDLNLIIHNVLFGIIVIWYGINSNYLFLEHGGFKDFAISIFQNKNPLNWKWSDFGKLLWESNFTKVFIIIILLISAYNNPQSIISNYGDFIGNFVLIFENLTSSDLPFYQRVLSFLKEFIIYLVF